MNKDEQISKRIDAAFESVENISRAEARPYLFTRISARMNRETQTGWEKLGLYISKPAVAFIGLCLLILINAMVFVFNQSSTSIATTDQVAQSSGDEFSFTVSTIYDFENK